MFAHTWAFVVLLQASRVLAQTTTSGAEPDCEASLIATLCDYKEPESPFAVASSGKEHCWDYCDRHQPCNYVVFLAGNPHTGVGTCWLYPGEEYDPSAGDEGPCQRAAFSVYDKPTCAGGAAPTKSGAVACEATNSPSPVAEVCDYPPPDKVCFNDCYASSSSSHCLSLCAEKDECAFAIFNALNDAKSPHSSGNCWVYPKGSFDESKAGTCDGKPEQFVYKNVCPKPKTKPSTSSTTVAPKETGSGPKSKSDDDDDSDESGENEGEGGSGGAGTAEKNAQGASSDDDDGKESKSDDDDGAASSLNALPLAGVMAMGLALFL